ncbi:hypothetical protein P691DRAFT_811889 [Macrolepiota fuliginosa MF-IS2]|uniref:Uncharacterized protein n=1 Tax=Macrolepiota fuliginosa MF-IS2 TaxID=1400762 RepID=A0A9P5WZ96_9AGAR|nr:hypothetical protein P691DRAFT_811889 [Macrolepiota fuliginosa MF-IS2]
MKALSFYCYKLFTIKGTYTELSGLLDAIGHILKVQNISENTSNKFMRARSLCQWALTILPVRGLLLPSPSADSHGEGGVLFATVIPCRTTFKIHREHDQRTHTAST